VGISTIPIGSKENLGKKTRNLGLVSQKDAHPMSVVLQLGVGIAGKRKEKEEGRIVNQSHSV
jgi:hypothetical protein